MDAFAVSICGGMNCKKVRFTNSLKVGLCFGIFQALMPFIGWFAAGSLFSSYIEKFDKWIALILLGFIGGKMLYDGIFKKDDDEFVNINNIITLLTSKSALAREWINKNDQHMRTLAHQYVGLLKGHKHYHQTIFIFF